jgi:hypothetical protein
METNAEARYTTQEENCSQGPVPGDHDHWARGEGPRSSVKLRKESAPAQDAQVSLRKSELQQPEAEHGTL